MVRKALLMASLLIADFAMAEHVLQTRLGVLGLHCEGCANRAQQLIKTFKGVDTVTIDLKHSTVLITTKEYQFIDITLVKKALKNAGFEPNLTVFPSKKHNQSSIETYNE